MKRGFYTIGSLIILLIAAFIFVLVPIFSGGRTGTRLPPFGSYDGTEIRYEQSSDYDQQGIYKRMDRPETVRILCRAYGTRGVFRDL